MKQVIFIYLSIVFIISHAQNSWNQKTNLSGMTRTAATSFTIGSKGYVGLGRNGTSTFPNDFWEYDPVTDSWTQIANYPGQGGYANSSGVIGTKAYVGLGGNSSGTYSDWWEYDQI